MQAEANRLWLFQAPKRGFRAWFYKLCLCNWNYLASPVIGLDLSIVPVSQPCHTHCFSWGRLSPSSPARKFILPSAASLPLLSCRCVIMHGPRAGFGDETVVHRVDNICFPSLYHSADCTPFRWWLIKCCGMSVLFCGKSCLSIPLCYHICHSHHPSVHSNVALTGGLLFLLAEGSNQAKRVFALLPGLETEAEKKNHMLQASMHAPPATMAVNPK